MGHIQVYFTSQDDLLVGVTYPGICTVRSQRKEYVKLNDDDIRSIIPELPATTAEQGSEKYYGNLIRKFLEQCPKIRCSFTLLKKTREFMFQGTPYITSYCPAFLQNNFKPVAKFTEGNGNVQEFLDMMTEDLNLIDTIRADVHDNVIKEENYVLLSGSDWYVKQFENSFLLHGADVPGFRFNQWHGIQGLYFKTQDKEQKTVLIPHHMLIIPFSLFCVMLPIFYISSKG